MMSVCQLLLSRVDSDETTILVRGRLNQTIVVEPSGTDVTAELPSVADAGETHFLSPPTCDDERMPACV